jgi:hypothetical protein
MWWIVSPVICFSGCSQRVNKSSWIVLPIMPLHFCVTLHFKFSNICKKFCLTSQIFGRGHVFESKVRILFDQLLHTRHGKNYYNCIHQTRFQDVPVQLHPTSPKNKLTFKKPNFEITTVILLYIVRRSQLMHQ